MMSSHRLLVVVLFLILPFPSIQSSQPTVTPPPPIDFKDSLDAYFVRESCRSNPDGDPGKLKVKMFDLGGDKCDVVIHTRKRGLKKLFVEIDIQHIPSISVSTKLDPSKSITITQGTFKIECKPNGEVTTVNTNSISIVPSPVVSFTEKRLYCSFIMGTSENNLAECFGSVSSVDVELQFYPITNGILKYSSSSDGSLWTKANHRCDPDLVDSFEREDRGVSYRMAESKEKDREWTCSKGRLYAQIDDSLDPVNRVECSDGKWKAGGKYPESSFKVVCGITFCSQCNSDTLSEMTCPSCTKAIVTQTGTKCSEITCTTDRWFLDGKWIENPTLECARIRDDSYSWTMNGKEVKKGACTSTYDCLITSGLKLSCDARKGLCQDPILSGDRKSISCDNANSFHLGYDHEILRDIQFECDDVTGIFKNGEYDVPSNLSIGCYKLWKSSPPSPSPPSTGSLPLYSWLPILIIAIILCIGGALLFFIIKRRQSMEDATEAEPTELDEIIKEAESSMNPNRGAVKREQNRIRLTKDDNEILKEKRRRRSKSSTSGRENSSNSSIASNKSNKSSKSRRTGKFKRDINPDLRAPTIEPYVITKENMVPSPRNASNCPDSYSTSMEFQNPRLRERAKTVSTVIPQSGATKSVPSIPKSSAETKKSEKSE